MDSQTASSTLKTIRRERGDKYGSVEGNHRTIGMQWGGILTHSGWTPGQPIPARVVCLMMVALKLNREAYCHQTDNINDGTLYLRFAGELSEDQREREPIQEEQPRYLEEDGLL